MANSSSRYSRKAATKRYKRKYLLVCEGDVTEPEYFDQLKGLYREAIINITCLKNHHSDPTSLIKRANREIHSLLKGDELWIILDMDEWTKEQFAELEQWSAPQKGRYVAISRPCFEIWLIMHETTLNDWSKKACQSYFSENISRGKKGLRLNWLTAEKLKKAVTQAKTRDTGQVGIIPNVPTSKVYQLIENIDRCKQTK